MALPTIRGLRTGGATLRVDQMKADTPEKWPNYPTGPEDSIFALGVITSNYARLEFAVFGVFTSILGLEADVSSRLMYKTTPEMRDKLMREVLPTRDWPDQVKELVQHFIDAHKICYENRNKIAHSNLHSLSPDAIILSKTNRDGRTVLANPLLRELRQVADDMKVYFDYGLWLSNMINLEVLGLKPREGDRWYRSWPEKPRLPEPLEYTSETRAIRRQG
jgi:hypothetical protein